MKAKALKQVLDQLVKVLANPKIEPYQRERLLRAKREFETVLRSGKLDRQKVFLATETVASVLLETLLADAEQR